MKTEQEIRAMLQLTTDDDRVPRAFGGTSKEPATIATVLDNAPRALVQANSIGAIRALKWVLGEE